MHTRISFKNKIFWKRIIKKPLEKLTLFFILNPVPFVGQSYIKQKELGTSDQSLFRLPDKFKKNFVISYLLSDQVWWCNIKWFLSYSKTYTCKFLQVNSWHHKLFHFHLFFWIWKGWKGRWKITKNWISREWKELLKWNKKHFSEFLKGYHWVKK